MRGNRNRGRPRLAPQYGRRDDSEDGFMETPGDKNDDADYATRLKPIPQSQRSSFGSIGREVSGRLKDKEFVKRYKDLNNEKGPRKGWEKIASSLKPLHLFDLAHLPPIIVDVEIPLETRVWHRLMLSDDGEQISDILEGNRKRIIWLKASASMYDDVDDEVIMTDIKFHSNRLTFLTEQLSKESRQDTPCSSCRGSICQNESAESDVPSSQTSIRTEGTSSPMPNMPDLIPPASSNYATHIIESENEEDDDFEILDVICAATIEKPIPKPVGFMTRTYYDDDIDMYD